MIVIRSRILDDRVIHSHEADSRVAAAAHWNFSREEIGSANRSYMHNLVVGTLADGVVTDSERRDLKKV